MAKWLSGGISRRADREENPDRDKSNCKTATIVLLLPVATGYWLGTQSRSIWTTGRWPPNLRGHDLQGAALRSRAGLFNLSDLNASRELEGFQESVTGRAVIQEAS